MTEVSELSDFKTLYKADLHRYGHAKVLVYIRIWHFLHRKAQTRKNPVSRFFFKTLFRLHSRRRGIEIPTCCKIGKGLYVGHFYNVTINGGAVLGNNCNIHKGVTIGVECRGARRGAPTIGNCVSIGVNATIVGKITIGDDVLIAANSFVNCDIPSHSVVLGNPCIIKPRDHATKGYVEALV
ncbi:MAG: serine acetyltransferase [Bacteroidales bacterium]|nr:serine acetyltransferase [Bacteroidales bacterium]